jgi:hypothetical protein
MTDESTGKRWYISDAGIVCCYVTNGPTRSMFRRADAPALAYYLIVHQPEFDRNDSLWRGMNERQGEAIGQFVIDHLNHRYDGRASWMLSNGTIRLDVVWPPASRLMFKASDDPAFAKWLIADQPQIPADQLQTFIRNLGNDGPMCDGLYDMRLGLARALFIDQWPYRPGRWFINIDIVCYKQPFAGVAVLCFSRKDDPFLAAWLLEFQPQTDMQILDSVVADKARKGDYQTMGQCYQSALRERYGSAMAAHAIDATPAEIADYLVHDNGSFVEVTRAGASELEEDDQPESEPITMLHINSGRRWLISPCNGHGADWLYYRPAIYDASVIVPMFKIADAPDLARRIVDGQPDLNSLAEELILKAPRGFARLNQLTQLQHGFSAAVIADIPRPLWTKVQGYICYRSQFMFYTSEDPQLGAYLLENQPDIMSMESIIENIRTGSAQPGDYGSLVAGDIRSALSWPVGDLAPLFDVGAGKRIFGFDVGFVAGTTIPPFPSAEVMEVAPPDRWRLTPAGYVEYMGSSGSWWRMYAHEEERPHLTNFLLNAQPYITDSQLSHVIATASYETHRYAVLRIFADQLSKATPPGMAPCYRCGDLINPPSSHPLFCVKCEYVAKVWAADSPAPVPTEFVNGGRDFKIAPEPPAARWSLGVGEIGTWLQYADADETPWLMFDGRDNPPLGDWLINTQPLLTTFALDRLLDYDYADRGVMLGEMFPYRMAAEVERDPAGRWTRDGSWVHWRDKTRYSWIMFDGDDDESLAYWLINHQPVMPPDLEIRLKSLGDFYNRRLALREAFGFIADREAAQVTPDAPAAAEQTIVASFTYPASDTETGARIFALGAELADRTRFSTVRFADD